MNSEKPQSRLGICIEKTARLDGSEIFADAQWRFCMTSRHDLKIKKRSIVCVPISEKY